MSPEAEIKKQSRDETEDTRKEMVKGLEARVTNHGERRARLENAIYDSMLG